MIGTATLDYPGVSSKGMTAGTVCAGLFAHVPDRTVPTQPPMLVVPVVVEIAMELVDFAILIVVSLEIGVLCFY